MITEVISMNDVEMSEHQEGFVVLVESVGSAITGFLAAAPLPAEWKIPATALTGAITVAIGAYWYSKVNKSPIVK